MLQTDSEPLDSASHNLVRNAKYRNPVNIQLIREISQPRGISLKDEVETSREETITSVHTRKLLQIAVVSATTFNFIIRGRKQDGGLAEFQFVTNIFETAVYLS